MNEPTPMPADKTWLALTESLTALTRLMRFAAGENNVNKDEAIGIAADAIKKIVAAFEEFNL